MTDSDTFAVVPNMKSSLFLLPFVGRSFAATLPAFYSSGSAPQVTLNGHTFDASPSTMKGFSLDLNDVRLVQMEGKEPVYMTELEKVGSNPSYTAIFC